MNVLVTYATRLGSTKQIAERVAAQLRSDGVMTTVLSIHGVDEVTRYDAVVIGSALYAGHVLRDAHEFVRVHREVLAERPVWLFSSGPVGDLAVRSEPVVPGEVRALIQSIGAKGHRTFAGALDRSAVDRASFPILERIVARRFVPEGDWRDWAAIDAWADAIASELVREAPKESAGASSPVATHG
jgi:menaquinone-dependent protoporphyrinogen oxidase